MTQKDALASDTETETETDDVDIDSERAVFVVSVENGLEDSFDEMMSIMDNAEVEIDNEEFKELFQ